MTPATRRMLIGVQLCFGVFPWLGKLAMEGFEPRAVMVWRLFVGAAVLMIVALRVYGRAALPGRSDLARLFGLSLLGVTINQSLFLEGLSRSTAVNAGLLMTVIPVATVGLAALLKQEHPTRRQLLGIALSVSGVAWLFFQQGAQLGADTLWGDILMTANALSYSAYLVFARPVASRLPQPVVIAWVFVFGALTVPFLAWDVAWLPSGIEQPQWLALGGVLVFPTILAYLGNIVVLGRVGANVTAAYVMLQPVLAALLGIGLMGERPSPSLLLTAVGVLSGLWFVSTPGKGAGKPAARELAQRPR